MEHPTMSVSDKNEKKKKIDRNYIKSKKVT